MRWGVGAVSTFRLIPFCLPSSIILFPAYKLVGRTSPLLPLPGNCCESNTWRPISVCLSVCVSVYLSVCLSFFLHFFLSFELGEKKKSPSTFSCTENFEVFWNATCLDCLENEKNRKWKDKNENGGVKGEWKEIKGMD